MSEDKIERLRIVTRGYELGSNGSVPPSQYLRYLEHIRWSTIAGSEKLPFRKFWWLGVVRSQVVEVHRQLGFNVEIELSMWMSRLGKTSVDFSHDIVRCEDGQLIGRSTATLVALDQNRRPSPIGEGAAEYLVSREAVRMDRLEEPIPETAWERHVPLRPSDHDLQQHVNHARYADFVEDTRSLCADAGGYGPGEWNGPFRRLAITYEREVRLGDPAVARTWCTAGRERSIDFVLMKEPGVVATRARVELASGFAS